MKTSFRLTMALLVLFVIPLVLLSQMPSAEAIDPMKIVLPAVSDKAGYKLPELNDALLNKLRSQFRFPKYETLLIPALTVTPDKTALERITNDNAADGAAVLEITYLKNRSRTGFSILGRDNDETFEDTDLTLTLTYFDKKTGRYGQIKANRSISQTMSIHSGALPVSLEALEEILNRLDAIFPRKFPGPRY